MAYTIVSHGVIQENDEGLHLTGGRPSTVFSGAQIQRFGKEVLVDLESDADPLYGYSAGAMTLRNVIPPGAFDVWVVGRVLETITTDEDAEVFFLGADSTEESPDWNSGAYFGNEVPTAEDTTWSPIADVTGSSGVGGYDNSSSDSSTRVWWPTGGHLTFNATGAFTAGQVRLVIFYSLLTPPSS